MKYLLVCLCSKWNENRKIISYCVGSYPDVASKDCDIPLIVRGTWFYRENGEYFSTEINGDSMTGRGSCLSSHHSHHVNYTFVFYDAQTTCYHCVKFFVRTVNILDKIECKQLISTPIIFSKPNNNQFFPLQPAARH